jgi:hypothetical protein
MTSHESLRQKRLVQDASLENAAFVQLPKRKAVIGKLSGARTENSLLYKGGSLSFLCGLKNRRERDGTIEANTFV